jgi:hypothetical protein
MREIRQSGSEGGGTETNRPSSGFFGPFSESCQGTMGFRLPLTIPSSYRGELLNSHGRNLTDKSYALHGVPNKGVLQGTLMIKDYGVEVSITTKLICWA